MTRRFSSGWTFQGNYTWSRTLGEEEGDQIALIANHRTHRNRRLDKRLLTFHRTHVFRNNGTWELPFGPGKRFLGGRQGWLARLVERWQIGAIFNVFSGEPINLGAVTKLHRRTAVVAHVSRGGTGLMMDAYTAR